jgi:DNA-binding transcriptional ArsR family regulator
VSSTEPGPGPNESTPSAGLRKVADPRALRALAHPTRIALLEAVGLNGALTATEAAAIVGGSVPNVAYHLRTLAAHGYVVEAEGGSGRERPWKLGEVGVSIDADDADPAAAHAARALGEVLADRWLERLQRARTRRHLYPPEVRAASGESQFVFFGTPAEMEQLRGELLSVMFRYGDRIADPALRPEGSLAFELLQFVYPFESPTESEG